MEELRRQVAELQATVDRLSAAGCCSTCRDPPPSPPPPAAGCARGRVKFYLTARGYGFITPEDGGSDVFFHHGCVAVGEQKRRWRGSAQAGELVEYQLGHGDRGQMALSVMRPGGVLLCRRRRRRQRRRKAAPESCTDGEVATVKSEGEEKVGDESDVLTTGEDERSEVDNDSNSVVSRDVEAEEESKLTVIDERSEVDSDINNLVEIVDNDVEAEEESKILENSVVSDSAAGDECEILENNVENDSVEGDREERESDARIPDNVDEKELVKVVYERRDSEIIAKLANEDVANKMDAFDRWCKSLKTWKPSKRNVEREMENILDVSTRIVRNCFLAIQNWGYYERSVFYGHFFNLFEAEVRDFSGFCKEKFGDEIYY